LDWTAIPAHLRTIFRPAHPCRREGMDTTNRSTYGTKISTNICWSI